MVFVDEVVIRIQSGDGGKGCESYFKRSDKKMVPTGGDGGKGGDVIIRADRNVTTLYPYRLNPYCKAESGHPGSGNQKKGRDGSQLVILVPCGTTVLNKVDRLLVRDLVHEGDEVTALRGGRGGIGNHHHGRLATPGEPCQSLEVILSFKLRADIFLVGSPNSGKSMLLSRLTGSKVKSETYPFSTKTPQLGTYETHAFRTVTLCELPPLVSGSSQGRGLGNQFLKHLGRAGLVFIMLDAFQDAFDPESSYNQLLAEIRAFDPEYESIPHFVVIGKKDIPSVQEFFEKGKVKFPCPSFWISAQTGEGVEDLMKAAEKAVFHETKC